MSTLTLQLEQLFMFQKFEQTMEFNIRYNGPILWNETDERFNILTPHSFKKELSMRFIKFY